MTIDEPAAIIVRSFGWEIVELDTDSALVSVFLMAPYMNDPSWYFMEQCRFET